MFKETIYATLILMSTQTTLALASDSASMPVDEIFYFSHAAYTRCPGTDESVPSWELAGPVGGPFLKGRMTDAGHLVDMAQDGKSFKFASIWSVFDEQDNLQIAGKCEGSASTIAETSSNRGSWSAECEITEAYGKYNKYLGRKIETAGFHSPTEPCEVAKSYISGYKKIVPEPK